LLFFFFELPSRSPSFCTPPLAQPQIVLSPRARDRGEVCADASSTILDAYSLLWGSSDRFVHASSLAFCAPSYPPYFFCVSDSSLPAPIFFLLLSLPWFPFPCFHPFRDFSASWRIFFCFPQGFLRMTRTNPSLFSSCFPIRRGESSPNSIFPTEVEFTVVGLSFSLSFFLVKRISTVSQFDFSVRPPSFFFAAFRSVPLPNRAERSFVD